MLSLVVYVKLEGRLDKMKYFWLIVVLNIVLNWLGILNLMVFMILIRIWLIILRSYQNLIILKGHTFLRVLREMFLYSPSRWVLWKLLCGTLLIFLWINYWRWVIVMSLVFLVMFLIVIFSQLKNILILTQRGGGMVSPKHTEP